MSVLQDFTNAVVNYWQTPRRKAAIILESAPSTDDARYEQAISRDISDRVTVYEAQTGLDGDFFIERIAHEVQLGGRVMVSTMGLEDAGENVSYFTLDTSELDGTDPLGY